MKRMRSLRFVTVAVAASSIAGARGASKYSLFANDDGYDNQLKRDRLCDIGDGYIYKEGEIIPSFETRCGPTEEFPCKCAPDLDPPILCSFCGFHSTNSRGNHDRLQMSTSRNFFCLKDGEISDPFVGSDVRAGLQRCSCSVDGNVPVSTCGAANSLRHPSSSSEETTVVRNPPIVDEMVKEPSPSDEVDKKKWVIVNDIREDDPNIAPESETATKEIEAERPPLDSGYNGDGKIDTKEIEPEQVTSVEDKTENDQEDEEENVEAELPFNDVPFTDDRAMYDDQVPFMDDGFPFDDMYDGEIPIYDDMDMYNDMGMYDDLAVMSNNEVPLPDVDLARTNAEDDVCTLRSDTGEIKRFQRGESFGDFLDSECNAPSRFACKCNPDLENKMECRHCVFQSEHGNAVCALDGQKVSFLVPGSSTHDIETCTCSIPDDPKASPIQECTITSHDTIQQERDSNHYYAFGKEDWSKSRHPPPPSQPTQWLTVTVQPLPATSAPTPDSSSAIDHSKVLKRSLICLVLGQLLITIL